ncbi:MAG: glutamyl-tRNA reductase [Imperialibacter sp.]|uniref:glutamyl-tRNA reductase n=1 Tax=Imperialibacter sp. TaxID=2038411 RepID=UPI0032EEB627
MHKLFKAVSLSYKSAPLNIRELVSFDEEACKRLLKYFKEFTPITEALVLSTCNRTEVYYSSEADLSEDIIKLIALERSISDIGDYKDFFVVISNHKDALQHLFDVSMGLEAQVVGDLQIANQVKRSYQWSADEDMAGPFLHRLMHTIFFTNKKVVQETSFRDGAASVSYAAVELIGELTVAIPTPKILIVGLGEIGEDVCRNLEYIKSKEVFIANRTFEKAEAIALECGFQAIPFDTVYAAMKEADVVISSVANKEPLIRKEHLQNGESLSFKYMLDLSVPRSIEKEVEEVHGTLLYNIDDIHSKTSEALEKRLAAIPQVKAIISGSMAELLDWSKEMEVSPTINKLKNALEQIRQEEVARYLKGASMDDSKLVEKVTRSMMQKIIKLPVLQLKAACKRGEAETLIDVLNDLFDLEKQSETTNS